MRSALPLLGFAAGMAVLLPLMLIFDEARPWIAGVGLACAAAMYTIGRANRQRQ